MTICRETAERMYSICQAETDADPAEIIAQLEAAVHEAMFRAAYCEPRCESKSCRQTNGGEGT